MKVFISWAGRKSQGAALALRKWLPDVIQTIEPWMSQHDIEAGARWNAELSSQLEQTRFGILCLTRSNTNSPWLLFEAGALAKSLSETFVCPYLIDLEPNEIPAGPLTQFQAKRANPTETLELMQSINKALKDGGLQDENLRRSFERWWGDLESAVKKLPDEDGGLPVARSVPEMVEEILSISRSLARSVQQLQDSQGEASLSSEWRPDLRSIEQMILQAGLPPSHVASIMNELLTLPRDWLVSPRNLKKFLNDSINRRLKVLGEVEQTREHSEAKAIDLGGLEIDVSDSFRDSLGKMK